MNFFVQFSALLTCTTHTGIVKTHTFTLVQEYNEVWNIVTMFNIAYMAYDTATRFELDTQKGWWRYIFHHVTLHF